MPPIINSEATKITLNTKDVFIEVTATDKARAEIVLNTICANFSVYNNRTIHSVNFVPDKAIVTHLKSSNAPP